VRESLVFFGMFFQHFRPGMADVEGRSWWGMLEGNEQRSLMREALPLNRRLQW
jgi:hypothetical protein